MDFKAVQSLIDEHDVEFADLMILRVKSSILLCLSTVSVRSSLFRARCLMVHLLPAGEVSISQT